MSNSKLIYGAHMSIAKGFVEAAQKSCEEYQANGLQIFLKSPRGRNQSKLDKKEAQRFRQYCKKSKVEFVVVHCSYLLNFAKDYAGDPWPLRSLISDLEGISWLGGIGVVLHIGKYLELSREQAFGYLAENLREVLRQTEDTGTFVIFENTAGQGTEIGWRFDELREIYVDYLDRHPRIRFCLDTAHAFAAGYDLRNKKKVAEVFAEFDTLLGLENLALIHLNDSKRELGSRVDRHANLGKGKIGYWGLKAVVKYAVEREIPLIIETPDREGGSHQEDLRVIDRWLGRS